jgi:preprotein translocase subunit SecG
MIFLFGLLSVVVVLTCLLLILLVLIQLPKKEAGAGIAFGGAATDALFGAGTGNVLTKLTKYATITFFVLLLLIGIVQTQVFKKDAKSFIEAVEQQSNQSSVQPAVTPTPAVTGITNLRSLTLTNAAPSPATSAPASTP